MRTEIHIPAEAQLMLDELESSELVVGLVPQRYRTNEGGMIRVAMSKNAHWYRTFCAAHGSRRRRKNVLHDTSIRRAATIRGLRQLISGRCRSLYAYRLLDIAQARAAKNHRRSA